MARHHFPGLPFALWAAVAASVSLNAQSIQDFFDGSQLHDIRLTMDSADWQRLHEKYTDKKTNYKCTFEWRDIRIDNVGLHTRGTGSLNPIKPGMGLEFAKFDVNQTFLGLPSVFLRNFAEDYSSLHERVTMRIFSKLGIPYQRAAHARLFVNGEYVGLYQTLEPLDNRFLMTRFGETGGYLYEGTGGTGFHMQDLGDDPKDYVPGVLDPKNHSDDPGIARIMEMVKTINNAPPETFERDVNAYLDLDGFVTLIAAEVALAEADGILSTGGMTNYYLYRRASDDRYVFIVWDAEMTFNAPDFSIWYETANNVLLRRALEVPRLRTLYLNTLMQVSGILGGPGGWLAQEIELEYAQIKDALAVDPNRVCLVDSAFLRCEPGTVEEVVDWMRVFARQRYDFLYRSAVEAGWTQNWANPYLYPGAAHNEGSADPFVTPRGLAEVHVALPLNSEIRASGWPLPTELGGVRVLLSGVPMPVLEAGPMGVLVNIPADVVTGPANLSVKIQDQQSDSIAIEVRPTNPVIQSVMHLDGHEVSPASPAAAGEMLIAWLTGLGCTYGDAELSPPAGAASGELLYRAAVYAGGAPTKMLWAGVSPGGAILQMAVFQLPSQVSVDASGYTALTMWVFDEPGVAFRLPVR